MATFTGTAADDTFIATDEADQFRFGENGGDDLILDFDVARDTLVYTDRSVDGFDDLDIASLSNGDAIVESNDQAAVLRGIRIDQLRDSNFVFATSGPRGNLREDAFDNGPPDSDITAADVRRREAQARGTSTDPAPSTSGSDPGATGGTGGLPDGLGGGLGGGTFLGSLLPDFLRGGESRDGLFGGRGNDRLLGGAGDDTLRGGQDDDLLFGGRGDDLVAGDLGDDVVAGNLGRDTLLGGQGDDRLLGNQDDDRLAGGLGADTLFGGAGNDTLSGDRGDDVLSGDRGADTYVFGQDSGRDLVVGFDQAAGDRLDLQGQTYDLASSQAGDAVLRLSGGGTVELSGISGKAVDAGFFA